MYDVTWVPRLKQAGAPIEAGKVEYLRKLESEGNADSMRYTLERDGSYYMDAVLNVMRGDVYHNGPAAHFTSEDADKFEAWFYDLDLTYLD